MHLPPPSSFRPQLSADRLQAVSTWLLEELNATEDDLVRDTDNGYTRGCTSFMRQRVRILNEATSKKHPWLGIVNPGNDLVFSIDGIPCRFSNDDPDDPKKDAVKIANSHQATFLDFDDEKTPSRFCFVIDRGLEGISDPHVAFLGFTAADSLVTRWVSDKVRSFHVVSDLQLAAPVAVEKPVVAAKRIDADASDAADGQS
jgi:hypothetical protein